MCASFALGSLYKHLFGVCALAGVFLLFKKKRIIKTHELSLFVFLFLCITLPLFISLIDSPQFERSFSAAIRYLVFLFAGIALVYVTKGATQDKLQYGILGVLIFWSLDGLLQFFSGYNLFFFPYSGQRVTGFFHPNPDLGTFMAIFSPLVFEACRKLSLKNKAAWWLLLPFITTILLGGSRTSWLLLLVAAVLYFFYWVRVVKTFNWFVLLARAGVMVALIVVFVLFNPWLKDRITPLSQLTTGDYAQTNQATSNRIPLWEVAVKMFRENWVNGIGVRAYELEFDKYANADNYYYHKRRGQPHLFILEIAAETGIIGLLGYVLFLLALVKMAWTIRYTHFEAMPIFIAILICVFPLSSGIPFYGYQVSALTFYLLTLLFIAHYQHKNHPA